MRGRALIREELENLFGWHSIQKHQVKDDMADDISKLEGRINEITRLVTRMAAQLEDER